MVARVGIFATISRESRQARKGATVTVISGAEEAPARAATLFFMSKAGCPARFDDACVRCELRVLNAASADAMNHAATLSNPPRVKFSAHPLNGPLHFMSYLVLARKWRPKRFEELAGQEHVVRALVNALNSGRVHHAFLFTGTRGVGKTTIARIFAKSLNCETGISANPCGSCATCREIDEGRFVDLLEVDAASRTKVDDTRELLDNVQYAPARGRYKVYLIDEVHMLSTSSFNALLKTLEEPPPHVKFLLATTDPQKLPATVLSRCLQFNLKRMPLSVINKRINEILTAEKIEFEADAVRMIAQSADGSMRDALSLLDQAIAFGGDRLSAADTRTMLGSIDRRQVFALAAALANRDARELLRQVAELDERAPDYRDVLADLASLLQRIALLQVVPDLSADEADDPEVMAQLAKAFTPEDVQLCYQLAVVGRRDLDLAPEPRGGFEMVLLRMVAFRQLGEAVVTASTAVSVPRAATPVIAKPAAPVATPLSVERGASSDWLTLVKQLNLSGPVSQLAAHCSMQAQLPGKLQLVLDAAGEPYRRPNLEEKLRAALSTLLNEAIKLEFVEVMQASVDTPARRQQVAAAERLQAAVQSINEDPNVQQMVDMFGAVVQPESIKPIES
jgi:DNA polymerase III subunit gamma/tau